MRRMTSLCDCGAAPGCRLTPQPQLAMGWVVDPRRYAKICHRFKYELVDPDQDPEQAQKSGVTAYGTVVVEVEGRPGPPIRVEAEQSGARGLNLTEEKLTNALLKVVRGGAKTV